MEILDLLIAASNPVLKVLLLTALGSFLSTDRINILGKDAKHHLNRVVFFVFFPALVGSNLAKTVTYESMIKLWFMPVNIFITYLIGSALGWMLIQITRPPSHIRGLILGSCAAGNIGNLLFIIIPSICRDKGSPFGAPDVCSRYGVAYSSLSSAIGSIYLWSYVYNIVRISSSKCSEEIDGSISESSEEPSKVLNGSCTEPLLSKDLPVLEYRADHFALPYASLEERRKVPISVKFRQYLKMLSEKINLKTLFAPSTTAAIVGFSVGTVPQIKRLMIGESAPLRVIGDSASLLGEGAIPAITLIMGGNLLRGTITQLFGAGERECSVILLWGYGLASVSLTIWASFFMWILA
ncbi:protein PIN-LIKES 1-like isoform X2 [Macadamia integrifolia]|uniref:protein PIN-LIKES 1-like isoform X2 n=1 Tax=Macadamia integrifolia TaxID=60698 RepID=UPI001C4FAABE|nr:protein PIN-LIKES 1-like isoform X2 [Macadamia integrifolia]